MVHQPGDHLTVDAGTDSLARRLGSRLRARRRDLNRTLAEVARTANVSVSYLSAVEKGTNQPSLAVLVRVVHALDLTIADVLRSEGQNHVRREHVSFDDAAALRDLSHPDLRLRVVAHAAEPGDEGASPFPVESGDLSIIVRRGELTVDIDGTEVTLRDGDALDATAPEAVRWRATGRVPVAAIWAACGR